MPIFLPPPEAPPALITPAPIVAAAAMLTNNTGLRYSDRPSIAGELSGTLHGGTLRYTAAAIKTLTAGDAVGVPRPADGRYLDGAQASLETASPFGGTVGLRVAGYRYNSSGEHVALDAAGTSTQVTAFYRLPVAGFAHELQLSRVDSKTTLGQGMKDKLGYGVLALKSEYSGVFGPVSYTAKAGIEHGLGGSRDEVAQPGLPLVDLGYTLGTAGVDFKMPLYASGATLSVKAGGQMGSDGVPLNSGMALGGPDRGSSYHAGVASAQSGAFASVVIDGPSNPIGTSWARAWQPFAGVNTVYGRHIAGNMSQPGMATAGGSAVVPSGYPDSNLRLSSAEIGVRVGFARNVNAMVSAAMPIGGNASEGSARLGVTLLGQF